MAPYDDEPDQPRWEPAPWLVPGSADADPDPTTAVPLDRTGEPSSPDGPADPFTTASPAVPTTSGAPAGEEGGAAWPPPDPTTTLPASGWDPPDAGDPDDPAGPAGPSGGGRRLGPIVGGTIAVLVLLVVIVILAVTILADDDDPPEPAPAAPTTTTVPDEDRRIDINGVSIIVPAGSLDPGAELDVALRSMPTSHLTGFTPVSPFLSVSVRGGEQRGPIRFEFPIESVRIGMVSDEPVLLTLLVDDDGVRLHEGRFDADRRRHVVELDEVTDIGIVTWDWSRVERIIDGAVDARPESPNTAPSCDSPSADARGSTGEAMSWCVEDGDPRIVRGRNLAAHAVEITWRGATLDDIDDPSALGDLIDAVPDWSGDGHRVLGPGGEITLLVPTDREAEVSGGFGDDAAAATWIDVHAEILTGVAALLDGDDPVDAETLLGRVPPDCATISSSPIEIDRNCFDPTVRRGVFGDEIEDHLATVFTPRVLGQRIAEATESIHDELDGRSSSSVSIDAARLRGGSWPTHAQDAPQNPELDWSRCIGETCIVGVDDEVEWYRWDGSDWIVVATVPLDTGDPAGALLDEGATEAEVRAFLDL